MIEFLTDNQTIIRFCVVHALFTLASFTTLSAGVLSVASIPYAAVAGFAGAWMADEVGVPIVLVLLSGVAIGAVVAWLMSFPLLRLQTHWIALASIALVLVTRVLVLNFENLTGGVYGTFVTRRLGLIAGLISLAAVCWVLARMRRARLGYAFEAVRTDRTVAGSLGMSPVSIQRISMVLSGAIAGGAGVIFANYVRFLSPDTFYLNLTFVMLAAAVLGGRSHWLGPVVGATVFTVLPELTREQLAPGDQLFNGIALIIIIIYLPGGLIEPGRRQRRLAAKEARRLAIEEKDVDDDDEPVLLAHERRANTTEIDLEAPPALRTVGLSRSFGGLKAVDDVSIVVPKGSIVGLLGPNGAGKSTVLNLLTGVDTPDEGRIEVDGDDVTRLPSWDRAGYGIARTFQEVRLFEGMTVIENIVAGTHGRRRSRLWEAVLMLPRERDERRETERRAAELMERVGVIGEPDQFGGTLSYANQRRLEIARALATEPKILMLDEPTAGMQKHGWRAVGDLLLELQQQGLTILVVEHNMGFVVEYCQRAIVMDAGSVLCEGEPQTCLDDPRVREAYFGRSTDADRLGSLIKLRQHQGGEERQP